MHEAARHTKPASDGGNMHAGEALDDKIDEETERIVFDELLKSVFLASRAPSSPPGGPAEAASAEESHRIHA